MRGLCGYHRAQVARCADLARAYWSRALNLAAQAEHRSDWRTAHQAYACAFDIAKLRRHDGERGLLSVFNETQLVTTAQRWIALSQAGQYSQEAVDAMWFTYRHVSEKMMAPLTCDRRADLNSQLNKLEPYVANQSIDEQESWLKNSDTHEIYVSRYLH